MVEISPIDFITIYARFQSPIMPLDCGDRCAPYNERGVPFCCDIRHIVPTAYQAEWEYLKARTNLWSLYKGKDAADLTKLRNRIPADQVLIGCLGYEFCQRSFRSVSCRAFPFFPYISAQGEFIGLSYYWEYEDRCWVISNLHGVTPMYLAEFILTFEVLFKRMPNELKAFRYHSSVMRRVFGQRKRAISLLHRNGQMYKVSPRSERLRRILPIDLPKFGPYKIAAKMPFPDEV